MDALATTLAALGLSQYLDAFRTADISLDVLHLLSEEDLKELGLSLGHRRKLLGAIERGLDEIAGAQRTTAPDGRIVGNNEAAVLRQISVLFCDIVNSTELTQRLDPELMADLLRKFSDTATVAITGMEGHIDRFVGDGVVAFFGYPLATEDAAERAVRAGLSLLAQIKAIGVPGTMETLSLRVAVGSGTVFFSGSTIQHGGVREPVISGEVLNLTSRLQSIAPVNGLVVSAETRILLRDLFELQNLGRFDLKGIGAPIVAWQVVREQSGGTRFEISQGGNVSPIAGREAEIALLQERWRSACQSEGQAVLISGEAGMGKSRIIQEIRRTVETGAPCFILRYQCSPFRRNTPFYPIAAQLQHASGIEDGDSVLVRAQKLQLLAALAGPCTDADMKVLEALLFNNAVPSDAIKDAVADEFKHEVARVFRSQLRGLAASRPVLMLVEDAHWMDPTTVEVLSDLLMDIHSLPVLVLVTMRPEFKPSWANITHVATLTLNNLSRRHAQEIIDRVAGRKLPNQLVDLIIANTDGIPLFVEELTKTVLEMGIVQERNGEFELTSQRTALTIPITLQDSLLARLDRHPAIKELAQVAAVIGREFTFDHLAALASSTGEALQAGIQELVRAELVYQRGAARRGTFVFKHALIQEAAYRTLISGRRQGLHARLAQFLIELSPEIGDTQPELIAHHFTEAGQADRAIQFWLRAGRQAARRSANEEAIGHLRQGLQCVPQLTDAGAQLAAELALQAEIGVPLIATRGYAAPDTVSAWERTRALAEKLGQEEDLLRATYGLWASQASVGETRKALQLSNRIVEAGDRRQDNGIRIVGMRVRGLTLHVMGMLERAKTDLRAATEIYEPNRHAQLGLQFGQNPRLAADAVLASVLWSQGYPASAADISEKTIEAAREFGHANTLAYALAYGACLVAMMRSDAEATLRLANQLISVARDSRLNLWETYGLAYKGWALYQMNSKDSEATQLFELARNGFQRAGSALYQPLFDAMIAIGTAPELDRIQRVHEAVMEAERREEVWCLPELLRQEAQLWRLNEDPVQANELLRRALEIAQKYQLRSLELRVVCDIVESDPEFDPHVLPQILQGFPEQEANADCRRAHALLMRA